MDAAAVWNKKKDGEPLNKFGTSRSKKVWSRFSHFCCVVVLGHTQYQKGSSKFEHQKDLTALFVELSVLCPCV